mmetsp:Transcript_10878/g.27183  ORF Transcript_10878/g.27183 Transcript_10878/m.27183 type:complete len:93 (-) Transcript_10878:58-336(-)
MEQRPLPRCFGSCLMLTVHQMAVAGAFQIPCSEAAAAVAQSTKLFMTVVQPEAIPHFCATDQGASRLSVPLCVAGCTVASTPFERTEVRWEQ